MEHVGHRERLRERFIQNGLDGFAQHEILELFLTYAIPRRDTNVMAHSLINRFGSLHGVLQASPETLMQIDGIGSYASTLISLLLPIFRAYQKSLAMTNDFIKNRGQAEQYCRSLLEGEQDEHFYVIGLDSQMRRINTVLIACGDTGEVQIYPRKILLALLQCNATGAFITHNHPGGSADPSKEDVDTTLQLLEALSSVNIRLYDHIIYASGEMYSMYRSGYIPSANIQSSAGSGETENPDKKGENKTVCIRKGKPSFVEW